MKDLYKFNQSTQLILANSMCAVSCYRSYHRFQESKPSSIRGSYASFSLTKTIPPKARSAKPPPTKNGRPNQTPPSFIPAEKVPEYKGPAKDPLKTCSIVKTEYTILISVGEMLEVIMERRTDCMPEAVVNTRRPRLVLGIWDAIDGTRLEYLL